MSLPGRTTFATPSGIGLHRERTGRPQPPVEVLVLQVQRRVVVADRADQQPGGVLGRARHHDLEARDVREVRLDALAVRGPGPQPAAERGPHRHRHRVAGAPVVAREHVDDRVERARDEVGELELHDRPQTDERGPGGQTGEPGLGDRGVDHAPRPVLVEEALGHLEGAAELADVLADDEDVRVALHLVVQRCPDGLEVGGVGGELLGRAGLEHRGRRGLSRHRHLPRCCWGRASGRRAPCAGRRWPPAGRRHGPSSRCRRRARRP